MHNGWALRFPVYCVRVSPTCVRSYVCLSLRYSLCPCLLCTQTRVPVCVCLTLLFFCVCSLELMCVVYLVPFSCACAFGCPYVFPSFSASPLVCVPPCAHVLCAHLCVFLRPCLHVLTWSVYVGQCPQDRSFPICLCVLCPRVCPCCPCACPCVSALS